MNRIGVWARWTIHSVWRETNEYGQADEYVHDADAAVIANRNTGYRWIVRRGDHRVEFQTPQMLEEAVAEQSVELYLTVEEAEALARAAVDTQLKDRRQKALVDRGRRRILSTRLTCGYAFTVAHQLPTGPTLVTVTLEVQDRVKLDPVRADTSTSDSEWSRT